MKKHVLAMTGIIVAVSLAFSPVTLTAADKWPHTITVGSFVKASASYPTNVALAKLITKYTPANGVVREYAGGAPGIEALARGDIDTWSQGQNDFYNAYLGEGFWKGKPKDLRLLIGAWYLGPFGLGFRPGEGIRSLKDLAGKKCMVKSFIPFQNKAFELTMKKAGVWDKIKLIRMSSTSELAPAMIEKKVDVIGWSIGAAYTLQIKKSVGIDWISFTEEEAETLKGIPGVVSWTAPPWILEMYDYPPNKVLRSAAYCFSFAVRSDMPDHVAYGILKAAYDNNHLDEVRSLSKDLTDTNIDLALKYFWMPLHSGAVKYYKDRGLWTKEMEAKQRKFLERRGFSK